MESRAVPVLTSRDIPATLAFYEGLGFANRGAPGDEWDYLILVREGVEIHVAGPALGERPAGFCFVYVDDADVAYAEWEGKAAAPGRIEPPRRSNFGMRIFSIFDRTGTRSASARRRSSSARRPLGRAGRFRSGRAGHHSGDDDHVP